MDSLDSIKKYLNIAMRRKYWIIIPFLVTVLGGLHYILRAPKIYEAKTMILVQAQKVPQDFVRAIVSSTIEDRLRTITEQVTSRTNLEKIIGEFTLYTDASSDGMIVEDKVDLLRKRIIIDVARGGRGAGDAFSISFRDIDPTKVMQVTNALASNFISENLKIRESQALGTSAFLSDELTSITRSLMEKEELVKEFRRNNMGSLPDQLQSNLSVLQRLQMQLEQLNGNLRDAENRKLIMQQHMTDSEGRLKQAEEGIEKTSRDKEAALPILPRERDAGDLAALKKELALLQSKYTSKHPDILRLEQSVASLEAAEKETAIPEAEPGSKEHSIASDKEKAISPMLDGVKLQRTQLQQIEFEIKNIKTEIGNIQSKIDFYQQRVEETPRKEQELLALNRDYDNLRTLYNSMLSRKLEAEIAVSMEKKQKGEQFRVVDPAKIPTRPVEPDVKKLMLLTLALALGLGGGLAYLVDFMDTSYRTPDEPEKELHLPVLLSIPIRYDEKELKRIRLKKILGAASVAAGFVISAAGVVVSVKGVTGTMSVVRDIVGKIM